MSYVSKILKFKITKTDRGIFFLLTIFHPIAVFEQKRERKKTPYQNKKFDFLPFLN